jgi:hypothetical protein
MSNLHSPDDVIKLNASHPAAHPIRNCGKDFVTWCHPRFEKQTHHGIMKSESGHGNFESDISENAAQKISNGAK